MTGINKPNIKSFACIACNRFSEKSTLNSCIIGNTNSNYNMIIISFQPGKSANNLGLATLDPNNQIINLVLRDNFNIDLSTIYYTSLLKCYSDLDYSDDTIKDQINCCIKYLQNEIEHTKAKSIIIVGQCTFDYLSKYLHKNLLFNKPVFTIPDFEDAEYTPEKLQTLVTGLSLAINTSVSKSSSNLTLYHICNTIEDVTLLCDYVGQTKYASFDIETTGLVFFSDKILTISISFQAGSAYVIPIDHIEGKFSQLDKEIIFKLLEDRIFNNPDIIKLGWFCKFDLKFLYQYGIKYFRGSFYEGTSMVHLLDENKHERGLKKVGTDMYPEFRDYAIETTNLVDLPLDVVARYNANDTDLTYRTVLSLENLLLKDWELYINFRNIVVPAVLTLFKIEIEGLHINRPLLQVNIKELETEILSTEVKLHNFNQIKRFVILKNKELVEAELKELRKKRDDLIEKRSSKMIAKCEQRIAGLKSGLVVLYEKVNFSSVPQLREVLYSENGFNISPLLEVDNQDHYGTDQSTLVELEDNTGFIDLLLRYRKLNKILSTYLIGIDNKLSVEDRLHANFIQTGTVTGRISCREPNLQNIPRSGEQAKLVKKIFDAPANYTLVNIDQSQIELRIVAIFSQDPEMLNAYANNIDLHTLTAKTVLGVSNVEWENLTPTLKKEYRTSAKAINFGFIYGMSYEKFKDYAYRTYGLDMSLEEAKEVRIKFFNLYKGLLTWHKKYHTLAEKTGYVRTLFGRKRNLPNIFNKNDSKYFEAQRQAVNSPIQGTAGELTIFVANILRIVLPEEVKIVNTVHDSLMLYIPTNKLDHYYKLIKYICENPPIDKFFNFNKYGVPFKVDMESGFNWYELKEVKF